MEKDFYNRFVKERLNLFQEVLKRDTLQSGTPWKIDPARVRFHLGESMADLQIPYLLGKDDEAVIEKAILELALLIKKRLDPPSTQEPKEDLSHTLISPKGLAEKSYRADIFLADSIEKAVAVDVITSVPLLDSWILKAWFTPEGGGQAFVLKIGGIMDKSIKDEISMEGQEMTSYFTLLALVNSIRRKKEALKDVRMKGVGYERLELMVGLVLFFTLRAIIKDKIAGIRLARVFYGPIESFLLSLDSGLTPMSLLCIPGNILQADVNPYKVPQDAVSFLTPVYDDARRMTGDIPRVISTIGEKVKENPSVAERLKYIHRMNRLREAIIGYLMKYDLQGIEVNSLLGELYQNDSHLENVLSDSGMRNRLRKGLGVLKKRFSKDTKMLKEIDAILGLISTVRRPGFFGWWRGDEGFTDVIEGFLAYKFDEEIERFVGAIRGTLVDRRQELAGEELIQEYERGRLYRFSSDDRPVLKPLALTSEGHLFVDMKDFTRKTLKVKEIAMAEFMKANFYKPILYAAGRYKASLGISEGGKDIRLNSLLGDALVFSGGVANLVSLAEDIQRIMKRYK
ncbi:MAG: hypothetical protein HY878_00510, partial [Deltaproteobacteria bacterium]|nr:hypothetical protein [Deltaproteobacteria bacterium]